MLFQELTFKLGVGRDEIVITVLLTQEINQCQDRIINKLKLTQMVMVAQGCHL